MGAQVPTHTFPPTYLLYRCTERSSYMLLYLDHRPPHGQLGAPHERPQRDHQTTYLLAAYTYEEPTTLYGQVHHEIKLDKDGVKHHTAEMAPAGPLAIAGGPETQEMHR